MAVSCLKKLIEVTDLTRQPELARVRPFTTNEILAGLVDICKWGYTVGHLGIEGGLNRAKGR